MWVKGKDLTPTQCKQVLASYVHRQTKKTIRAVSANAGCLACRGYDCGGKSTHTLVYSMWDKLPTDNEWIIEHAFNFIKDGSRLNGNYNHCVPVYMFF